MLSTEEHRFQRVPSLPRRRKPPGARETVPGAAGIRAGTELGGWFSKREPNLHLRGQSRAEAPDLQGGACLESFPSLNKKPCPSQASDECSPVTPAPARAGNSKALR